MYMITYYKLLDMLNRRGMTKEKSMWYIFRCYYILVRNT